MAATYIDEALILHALTLTAITTIVEQRVYHIEAQQDAKKPYVVLNLVAPSDDSEDFLHTDHGQPLFQWTCVSDRKQTPCKAFLVAHAIKAAFRNLSGSVQGITIRYMWTTGPREIPGVGKEGEVVCIVESEVHYVGL
jgi:hypothetical protein